MNLKLFTKHVKDPKRVAEYEIFGVSCAEVCAIVQGPNKDTKLQEWVDKLVAAKYPVSMYNYAVEAWEIVP